MSIETAGGAAALKFFGIPVLAGAAAAALGFMFMWPKSLREAFVRFVCAILSSFTLGPALVIAARAWWPGLFDAAKAAGEMYGGDAGVGLIALAAPFLVIAALPAWWLIGGLLRWFERRRDMDIAEMAQDAAAVIKEVRG